MELGFVPRPQAPYKKIKGFRYADNRAPRELGQSRKFSAVCHSWEEFFIFLQPIFVEHILRLGTELGTL